jgi:hypothetical protein
MSKLCAFSPERKRALDTNELFLDTFPHRSLNNNIYMYMCMYIYRGVDQNWRTNKLDQNYSKLVMFFLFGGLAWVEQTGITMTR